MIGHKKSQSLLTFTEEKQLFNDNMSGSHINRRNVEEDGLELLPPPHTNKEAENSDHENTQLKEVRDSNTVP